MSVKSRWTLPQVVHPTTYRKFVICVPNERFYIAAFQGLLIELTYSKNWQRDSAHTAAVVSRVWETALESTLCDDCGEIIITEEMDYQMSICEQLRFRDGKLQGLCCGEWVDITGQGSIPPGGGDQPGDGTDQPAPGDCVTYHAQFAANSQWYLPTVVNSGDTIEITNAHGAGNDGTLAPWHCPSGDTFFAGACIGGTGAAAGGDPLAVAHMRLIANIGGAFYDVFGSIFTVPGGVVNAPVFFQANDSAIGDNAGSYNFDVAICNNNIPDWCHYFDFALDTYGFTVFVPGGQVSGSSGLWVAGTGFVSDDSEQAGNDWFRRVYVERNGITAFHATRMDMLGDLTKGVYGNPGDQAAVVADGISGAYTAFVNLISTGVVTGNGQVWSGSVDTPGANQILLGLTTGETNPGNTLTGSAAIRGLKVYGKGPNPFGTSNCGP